MNPTASTTPSTSSSSSTTKNETSISSTTNDNSNPQQGTGAATSSTSANTNNSTKTTTTSSCGTGRSTKTEVTPEKSSLTTETTAQPQANDEGVTSKVGTADDTEKCHFKIPPFKRDSRKLFVGGLPPDVTDKEFKEFFSQYGTILDSIVMIDRDTKCSRGFGFVTFDNPSIALDIITNNKSTRRENNSGKNMNRSEVCINGKWCEVKASEPKRVTNVNNSNGHYYYSRSGSVPHQQNGGTTGTGTGCVPGKDSSSAAVAGTSATLTTGTSTTLEDVEGGDVPAEVVHYNHYYMMNYPNPYMYHPYPHHHVTTLTPPSYVTGYVPTQPSPLPHPAYAPSMGGEYYYHPHPSSYPTPTGAAGMIPPPQQQQQYPQPGLQGEWMYNNDYYYHDYNNMMYVDGGIGHEGGDGTYDK